MVKSQRIGLALGVAALAAAAATAFAVPAKRTFRRPTPRSPVPGAAVPVWKLMNLSDSGRTTVNCRRSGRASATSRSSTPPKRFLASRSGSFEKQTWQLTAVIERYRVASNGEIVFELYDIPSNTYMNAYMPNPQCLSSTTRDRAGIIATRNAFLAPARPRRPTGRRSGRPWSLTGVGYWNPVRTTLGALPNGAELRPVIGVNILQGCGHLSTREGVEQPLDVLPARVRGDRDTEETRAASPEPRSDARRRTAGGGPVRARRQSHARHLQKHLRRCDRLGAEQRAELGPRLPRERAAARLDLVPFAFRAGTRSRPAR